MAAWSHMQKASDLRDSNVRNPADEDLGTIEEVMLDVENGCVGYAVLSFGGVLGIGDKLFAVPWTALEYDSEGEEFILDVSKQELVNAPGFDRDRWPDMADPDWMSTVHGFYKTEPYRESAPRR